MATLKISDLSVGDWVYYDEGNTPYSIRSIYRTGRQDCVVLNDSVFPEGVIGFVGRLTPIPITAEILEANGFTKSSGEFPIYEYTTLLGKILRTTQVHLSAPQCINVFLHDTTIERGFYHREKTSVSILKDEVYIHDLQHALRLAGIDKEINL
jgi:hypothetical protein